MKTRGYVFAAALIANLISPHNTNASSAMSGGPYGSSYSELAKVGDKLFAAGYSGGGVVRSTDGGMTWAKFGHGLEGEALQTMESMGTDLFVASTAGKIFRSTDTGLTWRSVGNGSGPDEDILLTSNDTVLYAAGLYGRTSIGVYGGIFRSFDRGESWSLDTAGIGEVAVRNFLVDDTTIYVGSSNGIFKKTNQAERWERTNIKIAPNTAMALVGTVMFQGGYNGGLYQAPNQLQIERVAAMDSVWAVSALLFTGKALLVGAGYGQGIYRSTDSGKTWVKVLSMKRRESITDLLNLGDTVIAATWGGDLIRSTDQGATWNRVAQSLRGTRITSMIASGGVVIATSVTGTIRSNDGGSSWQPIDPTDEGIGSNAVVAYRDYLILGTYQGIFRSKDQGSNWQPVGTGTSTNASLFASDSDLFAWSRSRGLSLSKDTGYTWPNIGGNNVSWSATAMGMFDSILILATNGHGAKWSSDKNVAFIQATSTGMNPFGTAIASNGRWKFMATEGGVFRSPDGKSWEKTSNGLSDTVVRSMVAYNDALFAGTKTGKVFRSIDNGQSWKEIDLDLPKLPVTSILIADDKIWTGTAGDGIWQSPLSEIGLSVNDRKPGSKIRIRSVTRERDKRAIEFYTPSRGDAEVVVHDLAGRKLMQLDFSDLAAGLHRAKLDWSGRPEGMYIVSFRQIGGAPVRHLVW